MADTYRLTTMDNPYDPFEQFTSWFLWDTQNGYNTCGRIARLVNIPDDLTDRESMEVTERVIDDIIKYDPLNIYKKVKRKDSEPEITTDITSN